MDLLTFINEKGEYFGDEQLEAFIKTNQTVAPEPFNQALLNELHDFRGNVEITDDIAVLTCKIF